ncbi:MAG: arsenate reductase ArsC [Flavobacteriales bacterium]|nr:arsenate reductase ArsC [Flavobacteriales bacterium]
MDKILVLCTGNSCRSQMAHGWLLHLANLMKLDIEVCSAGVETHGLNPLAVKVMTESGIDISQHTSNHIDEYFSKGITHALTVCDHAAEVCPIFPEKVDVSHHNFTDPSKQKGTEEEVMPAYRNTRNEIRDYCLKYLQKHFIKLVE